MKYILTAAVTISMLMLFSCEQNKSGKAPKTDSNESSDKVVAESDAPLLLEDEPLLLDDADDTAEGADNSRCHVCHINYTMDDLAITHAKAGMGCASCHGASDEHIADESWASGGNGTAPDTMFPKDKINAFCLGCHQADKLPEDTHKSVLAKDTDKVCTDCHGDHRLPNRKCKWK